MKNLDFDITNIICIRLKSHNDEQLKAIALTYNISFNILKQCKENGMVKVWMPKGPGYTVAENFSENIEDVYFYPHYLPMTAKTRKAVLAIKPINTPKMPKNGKVVVEKNFTKVNTTKKAKEVLTVDGILDKISAQGMASLTQKELSFLKGFSE